MQNIRQVETPGGPFQPQFAGGRRALPQTHGCLAGNALVVSWATHQVSRARVSEFAGTGSSESAIEMSVYEITPRPLPVGTITTHRVVSTVERLLIRLDGWRRARRTEAVLRNLSDAQLSDIGLHRGQIAEFADALAHR
jgi:uncharacterized protein YjiS (DUF1127 family)